MRLRFLGILAVIGVATLAMPVRAGASSIQAVGQIITVTAKVSGQITVVVDNTGTIQQIFSNSDEVVKPTYVTGGLNGKIIPAEQSYTKQYNEIIKGKTVAYGMLYERPNFFDTFRSVTSRPAVIIGTWNNLLARQ